MKIKGIFIFKSLFVCLISGVLMFFVAGLLIWLATARSEDFYLRAALKSNAVASLWLRPSQSSSVQTAIGLNQATLSVWVNPKRASQAFVHFDDWMQEFLLVSEETHENADDEAYVLPPFPLPSPEPSPSPGPVPALPLSDENKFNQNQQASSDPYDLALSELLRDVWTSGLLTVAGSMHLKVPLAQKPLAGWLVLAAQGHWAARILDVFVDRFPGRSDGADLPSWLSSIPFVQVDDASSGLAVHEVRVDLGGRELSELFHRLCDLGNLAEEYCSDEQLEDNPLRLLFYASEDFRVQVNLYWSLRGQHFLWSNSKDCLMQLIAQPLVQINGCSDGSQQKVSVSAEDVYQWSLIKQRPSSQSTQRIGFWINHSALAEELTNLIPLMSEQMIEGGAWLQDFFQTSRGATLAEHMRVLLASWAGLWPLWGAEIEYKDSDSGALMTYARRIQPRNLQLSNELSPEIASLQFDFLNAVMSAWVGLPRSTSRLMQSKPWQQTGRFWTAETVYRLGWSELE